MAFTVSDRHDLINILDTELSWRAELRRALLTDDLLNLPQQIRELTAVVKELVEAQIRKQTRFAHTATDMVEPEREGGWVLLSGENGEGGR